MAEKDKPTDEELMNIRQLERLQKMVTETVGEVENRLADKLQEIAGAIHENVNKIAGELKRLQEAQASQATQIQETLEAAPKMIQEEIQIQLKANVAGIVAEYKKQMGGKAAVTTPDNEQSGAAPGLGGLSIDGLLGHADKIVELINAFRSPTTDQAMMSQMNFVIKWHNILNKIEKGGGTGEELTKQIAETFKD